MARIAGVDLPREKRVEIGLTYIYGIGRTSADRILVEAGVNPDTRCRDLTDEEVGKIRDAIDELNIAVEGDLRREIALNIKRLQEIGCYRGIPPQKRTSGSRDKRLRQMQEPEKARRELLLTRRNNL